MSLLTTLATILKYDDRTICLACLYLHTFNRTIPNYDQDTITLACLSLSAKITESPRRLSDLLAPAWKCLRPDDEKLSWPSEKYDGLRAGVITSELILLRVLKFDCLKSTPLEYLDLLRHVPGDSSILSSASRVKILLILLNPRCLLFTMRTIAASAIYSAMLDLRIIDKGFIKATKEDMEDISDCLSLLEH